MHSLFSKFFLCFINSATAVSASKLSSYSLPSTQHTSASFTPSQSLSFKPLPRESTKASPVTTFSAHLSSLSSKTKAMAPSLESSAVSPKTANFSHISQILRMFVQPPKPKNLQVIEQVAKKHPRKTTKYDFIRPALLYPGPPLKLTIPKFPTFSLQSWQQNNWFYNSDRVDSNMNMKTGNKRRGGGSSRKHITKRRNIPRFPSGRFCSPVLDELRRSQTPEDSDDEDYEPLNPRDYRQPSHPLQRSVVVYADTGIAAQEILEVLTRYGVVTRMWAAHPMCPAMLHTAVFQTHAQARRAVCGCMEVAWNQTIVIQEGDVRSDEAVDGWALWMAECV
jgi:hypothetical protein